MANPLMITDMVRIYPKPSLGGQLVMRTPRTRQTSPKVKAQQMTFAGKMRGKKIAATCKGKKARNFYGCLRTEGYKAYHGQA